MSPLANGVGARHSMYIRKNIFQIKIAGLDHWKSIFSGQKSSRRQQTSESSGSIP